MGIKEIIVIDRHQFASFFGRARAAARALRKTCRRSKAWRAGPLIVLSAASVASAAPPQSHSSFLRGLLVSSPSAPNLTAEVVPGTLRLQWSPSSRTHHYRIYEKRSPDARLRQVGRALPASASHKNIRLSAHLHAWQASSYVVAACNLRGCTKSQPVSAEGKLEQAVDVFTSDYEFHEPTAGPRNQTFGTQVALSGDGRTLAVSDIWYYGGSEWPWYGSGAVYVYGRSDGRWILQTKLEPEGARGYDFFGSDLALSQDGRTLAVGAQNEGYDAPSQDAGPGSVFIFTRFGDIWSQQAIVQAGHPQDAASFGRTVEISRGGNVLAVGAPYESSEAEGIPLAETGAVYVFRRRGASWTMQAAIQAPVAESYDRFGLGVRLSDDGRTIAVLAGEQNSATEDLENGGWPNRNNTVYVFGRTIDTWMLQAQIEGSIDDPMLGGYGYDYEGQIEGFDLSGNGRTLAIASPFGAAPDNGVGVIRLYESNGEFWAPSSVALTPALPDRRVFGLRLALSGNGKTLAATADRDDGAYGQPYVFVFSRRGALWTEASALQSPAWPDYTSFGNSLAFSTNGKRLVIGSQRYTAGEAYWGAVLVY